jgi:hypothetical protein
MTHYDPKADLARIGLQENPHGRHRPRAEIKVDKHVGAGKMTIVGLLKAET